MWQDEGVHELSIALSLVETVEEAARRAEAERVTEVQLVIGALSGVVPEALEFAYEVAVQGTMLEGSRLAIERVPAAVFCDVCDAEREMPGIQSFLCPVCGATTPLVVRGKELEVRAIEVEP